MVGLAGFEPRPLDPQFCPGQVPPIRARENSMNPQAPSTRDFTRTDTTASNHPLPPFSGFSGAMQVGTAGPHGRTFRSRVRGLPQWRDRQSSNVGAVDKRLGSHAAPYCLSHWQVGRWHAHRAAGRFFAEQLRADASRRERASWTAGGRSTSKPRRAGRTGSCFIPARLH